MLPTYVSNMTSELYTKKILLGKLREKKSPSESDGTYTMQTCILQPRIKLHVYVLSDPYFHLYTLRLDSPALV